MKKYDLASSMEQVLGSQDYKEMFSSAETLKKLAFNKVADENKTTEVEREMEKKAQAKFQCAGCRDFYLKDKPGPCTCAADAKVKGLAPFELCTVGGNSCHSKPPKVKSPLSPAPAPLVPPPAPKMSSEDRQEEITVIASSSLLKASEELEEAGFEELSARSLMILDQLIVEAKKRKAKKKGKKPASKSTSKSTEKSTKDSKKSTEKSTKESEKKSS